MPVSVLRFAVTCEPATIRRCSPRRPQGYPAPVVDHRAEREEALRRYAAVSGR